MSIMDRQNGSIINCLLKKWPKGTVAVHKWLETQGVYRQLVDTYVKGSWLEKVGVGALKKAGDVLTWSGGLYTLQVYLNLSVHVAGKTALQLQGSSHYIPANLNQYNVVLFGSKNEKLPAWFKKYGWKVQIRYVMTGLFGDNNSIGLTKHDMGDYKIKISSPERAALELCYDVPNKESFDEVYHIIEGLTTLRPLLVQELLEKCRSVKVKRLFMYLAENHQHKWVKKINMVNINFGSGKRSLCKNGFYNNKYKIVIPRIDTHK